MTVKTTLELLALACLVAATAGCKGPQTAMREESRNVPAAFNDSRDSTTVATIDWREYFSDDNLIALIDTALKRNQELNIVLQEMEITANEVRARKGEYLPFVGLTGSAGFEKEGRYTRHGAVDENIDIRSDTEFPEPLPDYMVGAIASWELDVWKKLRTAKKAAAVRYLASREGRNFMITNMIAEIASSYYELMALDNLLDIIQRNTGIQNDALQVVRHQKEAARLTQLAVNRFEAQLLYTRNLQYDIQQKIVETENRLNFLVGGFPKTIPRNSSAFNDIILDSLDAGIPSQLLVNRPDIRQAELNLAAARLDVNVARANFYPSFRISAALGFQAFNTAYFIKPESMLYNLAGDLVAPLVNRNAIRAAYGTATARQIQEAYNYERTILNAYVDVVNQLSKVRKFARSYETKAREVDILTQSVVISNSLFRSARADYLEVLLTQREALESRMELIDIKMKQMDAKVNIYRALGGGWN